MNFIQWEKIIREVNFEDLLDVVSILDQQKPMIRFLKQYPLFREEIIPIKDFDVEVVKNNLISAKKILQKIDMIYYFEHYDLDVKNNLKSSEVKELIDGLKFEYEFIYQNE